MNLIEVFEMFKEKLFIICRECDKKGVGAPMVTEDGVYFDCLCCGAQYELEWGLKDGCRVEKLMRIDETSGEVIAEVKGVDD